ncbi:ABC-2 type transport system permease protein [Streptosporangium subroseum]|uniref:Transport permease protein n=1 Tax=Streptosporangium subroseum TaxID=106412 RepID=A0A239MNR9_9ACTN|nr:ABC transporter permease [Streptosporangium subroseum]SNT44361.1 ABC-2 type transport system permease protein [Streptosporangium subroseum]
MSASTAVLKSEARLFTREPAALFWVIAFPTLLLTILGLVPSFRTADPALGGLRTVDLYVPVVVLLAVIMAGLQAMPPALTGYRERGILRRMSTTPMRPVYLLAAQIVLNGAAALGSAILAMAVGRLAYGVELPRQLLGYVLALVLATLGALAFGATITALSRTTKISNAVGMAVFFPAMFTVGVWAPVQVMPDLLQRIVGFTPFGAAAQALNQAAAGDWPSWSHLGVTALWTVILIAVAARWFRWE